MSKLIGKSVNHTISSELTPTKDPQAYQQNKVVIDILGMKGNLVGLLKSQSITVYDIKEEKQMYEVNLPWQVTRVVYSSASDTFYAIKKEQKCLYSVTNHPEPKVEGVYDLASNKWGRHDFEWFPWLMIQGQFVVLIRKFYGESLVVVFKTESEITLWWRFNCQEDNLGRMDQKQFAVLFSQRSSKDRIRLSVFDLGRRWQSSYCIEGNFGTHNCKAVKLYDQHQGNGQQVKSQWLTVLICINKQDETSAFVLARLWTQSRNYQVLSVIDSSNLLHQILSTHPLREQFLTFEFKAEDQSKATELYLNLYKLKKDNKAIELTHSIHIQQPFEVSYYVPSQQMLILASNQGALSHSKPKQYKNSIKLQCWKMVSKTTAQLHLLLHYKQQLGPLAQTVMQLMGLTA